MKVVVAVQEGESYRRGPDVSRPGSCTCCCTAHTGPARERARVLPRPLPRTRLLPNLVTDGFGQARLGVYINHAPSPGPVALPSQTGFIRFRESHALLQRVRGRPPALPPAYP